MNIRRPLAMLALAGAVSIGGLAVNGGTASALDNAPSRATICRSMETRMQTLVTEYHAKGTTPTRKIEINNELAELTKAHNAYCGSAGAVTQPTVKVL